jgi:hypothetical protein
MSSTTPQWSPNEDGGPQGRKRQPRARKEESLQQPKKGPWRPRGRPRRQKSQTHNGCGQTQRKETGRIDWDRRYEKRVGRYATAHHLPAWGPSSAPDHLGNLRAGNGAVCSVGRYATPPVWSAFLSRCASSSSSSSMENNSGGCVRSDNRKRKRTVVGSTQRSSREVRSTPRRPPMKWGSIATFLDAATADRMNRVGSREGFGIARRLAPFSDEDACCLPHRPCHRRQRGCRRASGLRHDRL